MIQRFAAITMFCNDVREEISGSQTIVGLLPDNIGVPIFPGGIDKIVILTRITLDVNEPPPKLATYILTQNGTRLADNEIDSSMLAEAIAEAKSEGNLMATVNVKIEMRNIPFSEPGRLEAHLIVEGNDYLTGSLQARLFQ
jgi:hypothetical protein